MENKGPLVLSCGKWTKRGEETGEGREAGGGRCLIVFIRCFVKNDSPAPASGTLTFTSVKYSDASATSVISSNSSFAMKSGPGTLEVLY